MADWQRPAAFAVLIAAAACGRANGPRDGAAGSPAGSDAAAGAGGSAAPDGRSLGDSAGGADGRANPPPADAAVGGRGGGDAAATADLGAPGADGAVGPGACGVCPGYAPAERLGRIEAANLNAVSGIAASWRNPGVLYVHNDRDRAEFFAVSEAGASLGQFTLTAATARDLEDIAVGRCPAGTCVFLADLGNNIAARPEFVIFRVTEPEVNAPRAGATAVSSERLAFTYPDGAHNAESLLVDPASGGLYVVTKVAAGARSAVYRLALEAGRTTAAVKVADLPVPMAADQPATGGSAHPCGAGFLLRTNNTLYEFRVAPGTPFEQAFRAPPMVVPVGTEMQGEAVAYRPDGRGYYTTSEGSTPPIHRTGCR